MRLTCYRRSFVFLCGFSLLLAGGCGQNGQPRQAEPSDAAMSAPTPHAEAHVDYDSESVTVADAHSFGDTPKTAATPKIPATAEVDAAAGSASEVSAPVDSPTPTEPAKTESHESKRDAEEVKSRQRREIQSGLLTAGSFDDVEKFQDYQTFLTKTLQRDAGERFPRWTIGQRVVIQVQTEQGQPVGNARVEVRDVSSQGQQAVATGPVLASLVTGSDGRALLLTGEDRLGGQKQLAVRVVAADAEPTDRIMNVADSTWTIPIAAATVKRPQQLDLALVIDTTGSMTDELEYLKVEIDSIATSVKRMFPAVDQRFALIVYRDTGDQYVTRTYDFTSSLADFRSTLSSQSADGGGDYPEAMHLAMEHAGELSWRKDNTARVMFLVGDAPPHQHYARQTLEAGLALRQQGVRIYPLGASGVALESEFIMRAMAFASAGQYLFLTDHSGIGNAHAAPHVPEFLVERLDRLMIRMIASELAGKRLAPTEVIAIERGEGHVEEGSPPEPQQRQVNIRQTSRIAPAEASSWYVADTTRWLMFAGLILGVFLLDAWERRRPC